MLALTFVFAVLNICLGFALAMYLGYGPAGDHQTLNALDSSSEQAIPEPDTALPSPTDEAIEHPSPDTSQEAPDINVEVTTSGEPALESYEDTVA